MARLIPSLAIAASALSLTTPALGADYPDAGFGDMRPAYPEEWESSGEEDSLGFELGARYWYSRGSDNFNVGPSSLSSTDTTHILEGHLRIDDYATRTYVKGLAGYAMVINGEYDTPSGTGDIVDGKIGYAGADFGYTAFGDPHDGAGIGFLAGYLYWNESPNMGRESFTTATSAADVSWSRNTGAWSVGFDSKPNDVNVHAMRLGIQARADLGGMFDLNAELAAIPYAWVNGTVGAFGDGPYFGPGVTYIQSSPAEIEGWGYGGAAEVMLGIHPTENMTVRLGGRAWYLQGTVDATYSMAAVGDPTDSDPLNPPNFDTGPTFANQSYITTGNPFSLFRYGALFELTYSF